MRAQSARLPGTEPRFALVLFGLGAVISSSLPACSGARFKAGEGGDGASAGSAIGTGGSAGESSAGGTGGDPGSGGSSGSAGTGAGAGLGGGAGLTSGGAAGLGAAGAGAAAGSDACSCAAGEYCRAARCYPCSDLSKLDFAPPAAILGDTETAVRFPRPGTSAGLLFFTRVTGAGSELWFWHASDLGDPPPVALGVFDTPSRAALAFLGASGMFGFDSLFDEVQNDGHRSIRSARFVEPSLMDVSAAPAPLAGGNFDDYSAAFAVTPGRAYWMSTRDGVPALRTGLVGSDEFTLVDLAIPATGASGVTCARQGDDATPWVTPDGRLLLFRALPLDADCAPIDGSATDLYAALLDSASGLPRANAVVALNGVNTTVGASSESDPSFSADLCTLYLASDGGEDSGHFRLYRAERR